MTLAVCLQERKCACLLLSVVVLVCLFVVCLSVCRNHSCRADIHIRSSMMHRCLAAGHAHPHLEAAACGGGVVFCCCRCLLVPSHPLVLWWCMMLYSEFGTSKMTQQGSVHGGVDGDVQIPCLVRMSQAALEEGKCVVVGLQSTGDARTADVVAERGEVLDDYVSGPRVGHACSLECASYFLTDLLRAAQSPHFCSSCAYCSFLHASFKQLSCQECLLCFCGRCSHLQVRALLQLAGSKVVCLF